MKTTSRVLLLVSGCLTVAGILVQFPQLLPTIRRPMPPVERLSKNTSRNVAWDVRNGRMLAARLRFFEIEFVYQSLRGESRQVIVNRSREDQIVTDILLTEKEALYITRPSNVRFREKPNQPLELISLPFIQSSLGYGETLPLFTQDGYLARPEAEIAPDESRREITRMDWRNQEPATLHRVSLSDGRIQSVPLDTQGYLLDSLPRTLTPAGLYWVRTGLKADTQYTKNRDMHLERLPQDTLMFTPLTGKHAQMVRDSVALSTLYPCGTVEVCGRMSRPYPDARHDLFRISSPDGKATVIPEYEGVQPPVEIGGRLFWFENRTDTSTQTSTGWLLSCKADGSDRRLEWEGQDEAGQSMQFTNLFIAGDRLYGVLFKRNRARITPREGAEEPIFRDDYFLARITPESPSHANPIYPLPPGVGPLKPHVAGDYYYFLLMENKRSPLDFLSEQAQGRITIWVCRVRLP